jgi:hypothetical protein
MLLRSVIPCGALLLVRPATPHDAHAYVVGHKGYPLKNDR